MKNTVVTFKQAKEKGEKLTMLTAYDYSTAKLIDEAGINAILVGDSLGMVVLGYEDTLSVTMEDMIHHSAAVSRGIKDTLLITGSITVDTQLLEAAGILEYELVQIVDVENGNRFETYTIAGEPGSGMICLNGAAARQVAVGDHVILMCYAQMTPEEAKEHHPKVVFVDEDNQIARVTNYEKHGKLTEDFI